MKSIAIQFTPASFIPAIMQGTIEPTSANYENTDIAALVEANDSEREYQESEAAFPEFSHDYTRRLLGVEY